MKVFITGSTGYIGFNVARAFIKAGHEVTGLTRSEEKAELLSRNNIKPIIGSMQEPESYLKEVDKNDVIILAAAEYGKDRESLERRTVESIIKSSMLSKEKKTLIYTSGTWVYGNTLSGVEGSGVEGMSATEESPLAPLKIMEWLPCVEEIVLNSPFITGIVMRPGCVYGGKGDMTNDWFTSAVTNSEITIAGNGRNRWAWVHVDDLAAAYLLAGEMQLESSVFNITDNTHSSIAEIISELIEVTNFEGSVNNLSEEETQKVFGDYSEALLLDQRVSSDKARRVLNWKPRHENIIGSLKTVLNEWKSINNTQEK